MARRSRRLTSYLLAACLLAACSPSPDVSDSSSSTVVETTTTSSTPEPTTTSTPPPATSSTTTDPVPEPISGEVLVVGDWGSGTAPQGAVAGAMQRHAEQNDASVILTTGDNFYSDDAEFLMAPYVWVEDAGMQWWIAWGNHDVETPTRIEAVNETFDDPPRWGVFQWDDFDVVILDSNQITSATQAAFFLDAMAASERPTIVVMHHPPYSCSHEAETVELVNRVVEVMDDDVVLVLSGHDHTFQRFESEGVSYVVTGGGGSQLYPIQDCPPSHPELIAGEELHHFLALSAEDGDLVVEAIDVNGEVFHEFVLELG